MASTTGFYGLQKLQGGDAISTNDYSFTNRNIDIIDRLLHKFDTAIFTGTNPIDDPEDPLSLEASTTGGIIPAGRTVRYKYTWVDSWGNETAASPESTITTNAPVARPSQPGLVSSLTGGTLLAGNYFYIFSAWVDVNTSETNGSPAATINLPTGSTNSITLTLPSLPAGATGFNIFRRGPGETQYYYLDSVDMDVATPPSTYIDDNSVAINNSRTPSATNLTYSTNSISITVPGATPTVPAGYTWKIYRTFIASEYDSSVLEWVITEDSPGVVSPTAYDYGSGTTIGKPPTTSAITGDTNRIAVAEADILAIEATLGTNPQGVYADVATRLDSMGSWYSSYLQTFETNPAILDTFSDLIDAGDHTVSVENGLYGGTDDSNYWLNFNVPVSSVDTSYVVKNATILNNSSVAYGFSFLLPDYPVGSHTIFQVDNEISKPGVADSISLSVFSSDYLNAGLGFVLAVAVDGVVMTTQTSIGQSILFYNWNHVRIEIDWAEGHIINNPRIKVFINGQEIKNLEVTDIFKADTASLDRMLIGIIEDVGVYGDYKFDNIYIETKAAIVADKINYPMAGHDALVGHVDPFSQYARRVAISQSWVDSDPRTDGILAAHDNKFVDNNTPWMMECLLIFDAPSGEDFQFQFTSFTNDATPITYGNFQFVVEPATLPVGGAAGKVYSELDVVEIPGGSAPIGVTIHGIFAPTETSKIGYVDMYWSNANTVATPVGAVLKSGSWIRFSSMYFGD